MKCDHCYAWQIASATASDRVSTILTRMVSRNDVLLALLPTPHDSHRCYGLFQLKYMDIQNIHILLMKIRHFLKEIDRLSDIFNGSARENDSLQQMKTKIETSLNEWNESRCLEKYIANRPWMFVVKQNGPSSPSHSWKIAPSHVLFGSLILGFSQKEPYIIVLYQPIPANVTLAIFQQLNDSSKALKNWLFAQKSQKNRVAKSKSIASCVLYRNSSLLIFFVSIQVKNHLWLSITAF